MSRIRLAAGVFGLLAGFYLLTGGGHLYVQDGVAMYHMAESLLDHGWFDVPLGVNTGGGRLGPDGRYYSPFGVLQPLLAAPLVALGRLLVPAAGAHYLPTMAVTWFNALATAALFAVLAVFFLDLGVPGRRAAPGALALAVSTPFWVYSRTFFSEPLAALAILASAHAMLRYRQSGRLAWAAAAGIWAAALPLIRPLAGVALPVLFLYLLLAERERARWAGGRPALAPIGLFTLLAAAGFGLVLAYNAVRFGGVFETGYDLRPGGQARWFTGAPLTGLAVLLASPGKSLFVFAPPALAALVGLARWRRAPERRPELVLALGLPALFLALLCRWGEVEGGVAWGPRLLLPALPVLLLGLAPLLERPRSAGTRALIGLTLAAGIAVQLLGVSVNFAAYVSEDYLRYYDARTRGYRFEFNPLAGHARRLADHLAHPERLDPLAGSEAAGRRQLLLVNDGDSLDFWWVLARRDGLARPLVAGLLAVQTALAAAGAAVLAAGCRKARPPPV